MASGRLTRLQGDMAPARIQRGAMVREQVASKAQGIRVGADMADLSLRQEGTTFSMDAVFLAALLAALLAELITEVQEELSIRVDSMAGAVRLHPSTTIMGEVLLLGSRRMDPQDLRLFSRTRRLGSSSEGRTGGVCSSTPSTRTGALMT